MLRVSGDVDSTSWGERGLPGLFAMEERYEWWHCRDESIKIWIVFYSEL